LEVSFSIENQQTTLVAGVDEAGRGPLAGPVIAAAVILRPGFMIEGIADSKLLTPKKREQLYEAIQQQSLAYAVGRSEVSEIDKINILQASLLAMRRAIEGLQLKPSKVLIDGCFCPSIAIPAEAMVKGDRRVACIAAASIVAKVVRDTEMRAYDLLYPGYGFAQHKGYATKEHYRALKRLGITPIHRRSFRLLRNV